MTRTPAEQPPPSTGDFDPGLTGGEFKTRSVRGGTMLVSARAGQQLVKLGAVLILARLLTPEDFGLIAVIVSSIGIAHVFRDLGLSTATVQRKNLTMEQVSTLFWLNVGFGLLMALLCVAVAPLFAWFYDDPRVAPVTMSLAIAFMLNGVSTQHMALLRRMLDFGKLARITLFGVAGSSAVAVALAVHGAEYWALVGFILTTDLIGAVLSWSYCRWRPGRARFDESTREMLSFGGYLVGFSIMTFLGRNLHNVLIGRIYGTAAVGLYSRAFGLITLIKSYSASASATVSLSSLSRLQDDPARFRSYYCKALRVSMLSAAPLASLMIVLAHDVIHVLFGGQWERSGNVLMYLAPGMLVHPILHSSGWLFMSRGKSREMMWWGIIGWSAALGCMLVGLPFELEGVAVAYTISLLLLVVPNMAYAIRGTSISMLDIGRSAFPAIASALFACAMAALAIMPMADWMPILRIVGGGSVLALSYIAALVFVFNQGPFIADLFAQLRNRKRLPLPR